MRMIDPPDGWRYGFPKPFNPQPGQSTEDWLLKNGYPEHLVAQWPNGVWCRVYDVEARPTRLPAGGTD